MHPPEELIRKYDFLDDLPVEEEFRTLEVYLFPDTYTFTYDMTPEDIVEMFLMTFSARVDEQMREEIRAQGKTLHEVVTLASIVEGEVRTQEDRRLVADLFWRRLENDMLLQSDVTVAYALGTNKIQHSVEETQTDSPYNTYVYKGLPPGPVSNPSLDAMQAVMYPLENPFVFFLSNPQTGQTVFAQTYEEHLKNQDENGL